MNFIRISASGHGDDTLRRVRPLHPVPTNTGNIIYQGILKRYLFLSILTFFIEYLLMHERKVLELTRKILAPRCLTFLEEQLLLSAWSGKFYREIALELGYDEGYLKDVGSHLWLSLSKQMGRQVTKKNYPIILREYIGQHPQESFWLQAIDLPGKSSFPDYPLPFGSPLYIQRSPIEELAIDTIAQPGSLLRIKASRSMGKTSLINHVLGVARQAGMNTVVLDMRQVTPDMLRSLDQFLRWFCCAVGQQLKLPSQLNEYWLDGAGSQLNCTIYMQEYLLNSTQSPVVLALDKVHYLAAYPELKGFFGLLRSWYEQARSCEQWQRLRSILVYSGNLDLSLPCNQSPLNVGLLLTLPELTFVQIQSLANCYALEAIGIKNFLMLNPLLQLTGGHPYLLQIAFYWLRSGQISLAQLVREAPTPQGIYADHLLSLWLSLQHRRDLLDAFAKVLLTKTCCPLHPVMAYELESLGLITLQQMQANIRCDLYRQYFEKCLEGQYA